MSPMRTLSDRKSIKNIFLFLAMSLLWRINGTEGKGDKKVKHAQLYILNLYTYINFVYSLFFDIFIVGYAVLLKL